MKLMSSKDLVQIQDKFILLDTNVIIDSTKFPEEFGSFYKLLSDRSVTPILDHTTRLEFVRSAKTKSDKQNYENFLNLIFSNDRIEMPPSLKLFGIAENISLIVSRMENNSIELGDSLISAQLANGKSQNLFLATENHQDFPSCLFERLHLEIVYLPNGKIKTVGIYKFLKENYEKLSFDLLGDTDFYKLKTA